MTSEAERDALAKVIFLQQYPGSEGAWDAPGDYGKASWYERADAILTAGWRRPRTVTTVEELDALPVGSIVLEGNDSRPIETGFGFSVIPGVFHRFPQGWFVAAGLGESALEEIELPATVLFEPEGGNDE